MTIAVDFDGTIVEHQYPNIGRERPMACATLRRLMEEGHHLILWSVREGDLLKAAVDWCEERGVIFYAVNETTAGLQPGSENWSRKVIADMYIDDRNCGGLPHWSLIYRIISEKLTMEDVMMQELAHQQGMEMPEPEEEEEEKPKKWWWPF